MRTPGLRGGLRGPLLRVGVPGVNVPCGTKVKGGPLARSAGTSTCARHPTSIYPQKGFGVHVPGWTRLDVEVEGMSLWKHYSEEVHVATNDLDHLLFLRAALVSFEHMTPEEFTDFVTEAGA